MRDYGVHVCSGGLDYAATDSTIIIIIVIIIIMFFDCHQFVIFV